MKIDPAQIADRIARERYNVPVTIQPISGLNSFVFRLQFDDRPPRILKLTASLKRELAAIEMLRAAGIPCAGVDFSDLSAPLPYAIFQSAGETTVMNHLSDDALGKSLVVEMASLLARIHRITPHGENASCLPKDPGTTLVQLHQLADAIANAGILTREEVRAFKALAMPEVGGASLCHGDFHSVQCVVDGGRITAVVDWGAAWIGNPLIDLAVALCYFDYYAPTYSLQFLETYRSANPLPEDFEKKYLPVRMAHALGLIRVFTEQRLQANVLTAVRIFRVFLATTQRNH